MPKIKLSNKTHITSGCNRAIHLHPNSDDLIIKVRRTDKHHRGHSTRKKWMYKTFPETLYRGFYIEIFHEINIRIKADILGINSPIAPTRGFVETTHGFGMVMERVGPKENKLGPTLRNLSLNNLLNDKKIKLLNDLIKSVFALKVVCADINANNIVWSGAHNSFYIVDGFGDRNFIKLKTLFSFIRNQRLNRDFTKMANVLDLNWSVENQLFTRI